MDDFFLTFPVHKIGERRRKFFGVEDWCETTPNIIEKLRLAHSLTINGLARLAGIERNVLKNILCGKTRRPHRRTLARIEDAFVKVEMEHLNLIRRRHREIIRAIAACEHVGQRKVLEMDLSRQRPRDRDWLTAARISNLATYILIVELGVQPTAVASAIGNSRTAITKAIRRYEDQRDRPRLEHIIDAVRTRLHQTGA